MRGPRTNDRSSVVEAQRAAALQITLVSLTVASVLLVVGSALIPTQTHPEALATVYLPLFASYGGAALLARSGRTRSAAALVTTALFVIVTAAVYFFGGLSGQLASAYFIVIITSALTLGSGVAFAFTALVLATSAVLVYLELAGLLPAPYHTVSPLDHLVSLAGTLALVAVLLRRSLRETEHALIRATDAEREHLESLHALRLATDSLQTQARRESAIRDLAENLLSTSDAEQTAEYAAVAVESSFPGTATCLLVYASAELTLRRATPNATIELSQSSIHALHESVGDFQEASEVTVVDAQGESRIALVVSLVGRITSYGVLLAFPEEDHAREALRDWMTTVGRVLGSAFERGRAERQLREGLRLESLGHLAGGIVHDFRNLLTVIMGAGEAMRRAPGERERQLANEIVETSWRAADLTQQLLAFSRREDAQLDLVELDEVTERLSRILSRTLGPNIELELDLGSRGTPILADRPGLEQILMNLAVNARDAMPNGGRLLIRTRSSSLPDPELPAAQKTVILSVEDEGIGMSEQVLARVVEPFFTTKSPGEGTGLGLATVDGVVAALGGRLEIESALGHGTRVRCIFPAGEEETRSTAKRRKLSPRAPFEPSA